jgi:hypothetical protein
MQTQSVTYLKRDSAPSSYHDLLELAQDGNTTASCPHDRRVAGGSNICQMPREWQNHSLFS